MGSFKRKRKDVPASTGRIYFGPHGEYLSEPPPPKPQPVGIGTRIAGGLRNVQAGTSSKWQVYVQRQKEAKMRERSVKAKAQQAYQQSYEKGRVVRARREGFKAGVQSRKGGGVLGEFREISGVLGQIGENYGRLWDLGDDPFGLGTQPRKKRKR